MTDLTLSPRQVECCVLVAAGYTDKGIAKELGIGPRTVEQHLNDAARRIRKHMPSIRGTRPRHVIFAYYVEFAGVAAFQRREGVKLAA